MSSLRRDAESIWRAGLEAVRPQQSMRAALADPALRQALHNADHIIVVGAGKAGAAMAQAVEAELADLLPRVSGLVNVPADAVQSLQAIRLHAARPAGHNQPTAEGIQGAEAILSLVAGAGSNDVVLCLLSGGGSALLPAPAPGISLQEKQDITLQLHACGATITEMNAVRKHLSRIKGGLLAQAFHGKLLLSLIISDVIGDPLDVIASGPTVPDPTTFADALAVMERYGLADRAPAAVMTRLQSGAAGQLPETPKQLPANIEHRILANNATALAAAADRATELGYLVFNLGSCIDGDTRAVAEVLAGILQGIRRAGQPICLLTGGETTVTLGADHGLGGRNQELVLAAALKLGKQNLQNAVLLSAGTDGEDGPTDAAGAVADARTLELASAQNLDPAAYLSRHDVYHFFEATGDLFKTGLTQTNVMDLRVFVAAP